jgi:hypothetical protein
MSSKDEWKRAFGCIGVPGLLIAATMATMMYCFNAASGPSSPAPGSPTSSTQPDCADGYQSAATNINIGTKIYYDVGGGQRAFAGTVIGTGDYEFDDGRARAVQLQLSDGSTRWQKRNAMVFDTSWVVPC